TARQLALDDRLAGEDAGIHVGHEHLNRPAQPLLQRIERADVIAVAVRQRDPPDRLARFLRGSDQRPGASAERRVDQREAVLLANEVGVDETPTGQLRQVLREYCGPHLVSRPCLLIVGPYLISVGRQSTSSIEAKPEVWACEGSSCTSCCRSMGLPRTRMVSSPSGTMRWTPTWPR